MFFGALQKLQSRSQRNSEHLSIPGSPIPISFAQTPAKLEKVLSEVRHFSRTARSRLLPNAGPHPDNPDRITLLLLLEHLGSGTAQIRDREEYTSDGWIWNALFG
jgi:hypothetical protein